MTAVRRDGLALVYASEDLKNDRDVVTAAVEQILGSDVSTYYGLFRGYA